MKYFKSFLSAILLLLLVGSVSAGVTAKKGKTKLPNFIYCVSDDQGWGDVGYNGHPVIKTPNLDRMAREGLQCDRFYAAAAVCSPTRVTLVTGRNNWRVNISSPTSFGEASLPKEEITLAQYLKPLGYTSAHFGKWHIGELDKELAQHHYMPPWEAGFDVTFSTRNVIPTCDPYMILSSNAKGPAARLKVNKQLYYDNGVMIPLDIALKDPTLQGDDCRIMMDRAVKFIREMAAKEEPFYIYLCFHAVHTKLIPVEKYHEKYYSDMTLKDANYFTNISAIDAQMGRLRDLLKKLNIADNTMLWFSSDNGPNLKSKTGVKFADAQDGKFNYTRIGSTGAFKGWKRYEWEGGLRVCGLIEWPDVIKGNLSRDYPIVTTDFVPTALAAVGITPSPDKPLDGENIMPFLRGERTRREIPIAFHSCGWDAWMTHRYKIVKGGKAKQIGGTTNGKWELYDMEKDPFEEHNIVEKYPNVFQKLYKDWEKWAEGAAKDCAETAAKYPSLRFRRQMEKEQAESKSSKNVKH